MEATDRQTWRVVSIRANDVIMDDIVRTDDGWGRVAHDPITESDGVRFDVYRAAARYTHNTQYLGPFDLVDVQVPSGPMVGQ